MGNNDLRKSIPMRKNIRTSGACRTRASESESDGDSEKAECRIVEVSSRKKEKNKSKVPDRVEKSRFKKLVIFCYYHC